MAKSITGYVALIAILSCLLGGLVSYAAFPQVVTKEVVVTKKVPVEVEKVVKVPVDAREQYLETAVNDVINYLEDEEELTCNGVEYDKNEVSVLKIYDDFSVSFDEEGYSVEGKVKLKFKDEESCKRVIDFVVAYEPDEEPTITL